MNTDRIEKTILLRASQSRVWRALVDSQEFGAWFGVHLEQPFAPGASIRGTINPSMVDLELAEAQKSYEGLPFDITIELMEPETLFSFRWHPYAVEPGEDYSNQPTTLVAFVLEPVSEGTKLTVTESGFDRIPIARRAKAFTENEKGWEMVVKVIGKYLAQAA